MRDPAIRSACLLDWSAALFVSRCRSGSFCAACRPPRDEPYAPYLVLPQNSHPWTNFVSMGKVSSNSSVLRALSLPVKALGIDLPKSGASWTKLNAFRPSLHTELGP